MRTRQLTVANAGAMERTFPARSPNVSSDVAVPLCQATVYGLLLGLPPAIGVCVIGGHWVVMPAFFLIVAGVAWHLRLRHIDETGWTHDRLSDPNGAGHAPETPRPDMVLMDAGKGAEEQRRRQMDAEIARVIDFITVAGFGATSIKALAAHGYTRSEAEALRGVLFAVGVADWKPGGKAEGWGLTMPTEEAVEAWLSHRFD